MGNFLKGKIKWKSRNFSHFRKEKPWKRIFSHEIKDLNDDENKTFVLCNLFLCLSLAWPNDENCKTFNFETLKKILKFFLMKFYSCFIFTSNVALFSIFFFNFSLQRSLLTLSSQINKQCLFLDLAELWKWK